MRASQAKMGSTAGQNLRKQKEEFEKYISIPWIKEKVHKPSTFILGKWPRPAKQ